jgi:hypothetical protein
MRCAGSGRKPGLPVRTGGARSLASDDRRSGGGSPQTIAAHQGQSYNRLCRKFSQSSSNFAQASVVDAAYVSFGSGGSSGTRICPNGSGRRRDRRSRTEKMKPYLMLLFIGSIMALSDAVGPARQSSHRTLWVLDIIRNTHLFRRFS